MLTRTVRHALEADHVIALGPGGRIEAQGPPKNLTSLLKGISGSQPGDAKEGHPKTDATDLQSEIGPETTVDQELHTELSRQTGDGRLYAYYFSSLGWLNSLGVIVADAIFTFCTVFPTVWIKWWSEAQLETPGKHMDMYMGIYGMFSLVAAIVFFAVVYMLLHSGMPRSSLSLHRKLLSVLITAPYWFFVSTDGGQILNRFSQDMSLIDMQLPMSFVNTAFSLLIVIMQAGIIGASSKWAVAMFPGLFVALYALQKFYLRTSRQLRLLELEAKSPLYTHFTETLRGLSTIRAFDWQIESAQTNLELLDESQKPYYLLWSIQRWLTFVLDCNVAIIATVIIAVATQLGDISPGSLGMVLVNILTFSGSLTYLIRAWVDLETSLGAVARIRDFEEKTPSETLPREMSEPPEEWPATGRIELRNLSVAYKYVRVLCKMASYLLFLRRSGDSRVLKGLNLSIQHGEKIAICGRTGR
jgi:ABC-type multidrug transport system fused ATPase/permease subunit